MMILKPDTPEDDPAGCFCLEVKLSHDRSDERPSSSPGILALEASLVRASAAIKSAFELPSKG